MSIKRIEGWDKIDYPTPLFVRMSIFYAVVLVLSNILASKIIQIGFVFLPAAVILFPLVYIVSDVMTEVYGMRLSLLAIRSNVFMNLLLIVITYIATKLPPAPFSQDMQVAFERIFHFTWRIVLASMIAYYLGDWSNSAVVSRLKVLQNGRNFPLRAWLSTVVGEGVDTLLFITIAFAGSIPGKVLFNMILSQYLFKITYELVCLPITTQVVKWWKRAEGFEVYDYTDDPIKTYRPI
jgi:uncharacterized integral membrane protein (TIGR00697 family)